MRCCGRAMETGGQIHDFGAASELAKQGNVGILGRAKWAAQRLGLENCSSSSGRSASLVSLALPPNWPSGLSAV